MDYGIVGKNQTQNDLQNLNKHLAPTYHKFQKWFANTYTYIKRNEQQKEALGCRTNEITEITSQDSNKLSGIPTRLDVGIVFQTDTIHRLGIIFMRSSKMMERRNQIFHQTC